MTTRHETWLEQGDIYSIGALDGEQLKDFQVHLAGCAICERHVRETRQTLSALCQSIDVLTPPSSVKAGVLATITAAAETRRAFAPRRVSMAWHRWFFAGAVPFAAAAIFVFLIWNIMATRNEVARLKTQLAAMQLDATQNDALIQSLSDPEVRSIQLAGLAAAPQARGKLFWNPATRRGLLLTFGLPRAAPDQAYELWGIAGDEPVPAGVFLVDDRGETRFVIPELARERSFDKFAVTLESAGGVSKPSGPMVLLGTL